MKVTDKYIKPESIEELKQIVSEQDGRQIDGFIGLGCCRSSKTIWVEETPTGQFRFGVFNDIDGSYQSLSVNTIKTRSNIGEAVENGAFWFWNTN